MTSEFWQAVRRGVRVLNEEAAAESGDEEEQE